MTTVLLVDDEKLILRSLEKTLLRAGFDVEVGFLQKIQMQLTSLCWI
jgi:DNA-binding response OmpR family regulator